MADKDKHESEALQLRIKAHEKQLAVIRLRQPLFDLALATSAELTFMEIITFHTLNLVDVSLSSLSEPFNPYRR